MKKTVLIFAFIICVSVFISYSAAALIQSSPKENDIRLSVAETDVKPAVDGVISDNEYEKLDIRESMLSYVVGAEADWYRVNRTEFGAYAALCEGRLYFALEVNIGREYIKTECSAKNMWAQTCLLMSFADKDATGRTALELGIREDAIYIWQNAKGREAPLPEYAAKFKDGVCTYEFSVELSSFCDENAGEFKFCFSISAGDYYDNGRIAYIQLGKGISGFYTSENIDAGKDDALFPLFTVAERQTAETEQTETEPVSEPEIPHANDDIMATVSVIAAVICVITAMITVRYGKKLLS